MADTLWKLQMTEHYYSRLPSDKLSQESKDKILDSMWSLRWALPKKTNQDTNDADNVDNTNADDQKKKPRNRKPRTTNAQRKQKRAAEVVEEPPANDEDCEDAPVDNENQDAGHDVPTDNEEPEQPKKSEPAKKNRKKNHTVKKFVEENVDNIGDGDGDGDGDRDEDRDRDEDGDADAPKSPEPTKKSRKTERKSDDGLGLNSQGEPKRKSKQTATTSEPHTTPKSKPSGEPKDSGKSTGTGTGTPRKKNPSHHRCFMYKNGTKKRERCGWPNRISMNNKYRTTIDEIAAMVKANDPVDCDDLKCKTHINNVNENTLYACKEAVEEMRRYNANEDNANEDNDEDGDQDDQNNNDADNVNDANDEIVDQKPKKPTSKAKITTTTTAATTSATTTSKAARKNRKLAADGGGGVPTEIVTPQETPQKFQLTVTICTDIVKDIMNKVNFLSPPLANSPTKGWSAIYVNSTGSLGVQTVYICFPTGETPSADNLVVLMNDGDEETYSHELAKLTKELTFVESFIHYILTELEQ